MNFLSRAEIQAEILSLPEPTRSLVKASWNQRTPPTHCYRMPSDTARLAALGRILMGLVQFKKAPIIWISETIVWSADEDLDLLRGYRRGLGESRDEGEAPATKFFVGEETAFLSIIRMALFFTWDTWIFESQSNRLCMQISHDAVISMWTGDETTSRFVSEAIKRFSLTELQTTPR
jgi:hypothetical protein